MLAEKRMSNCSVQKSDVVWSRNGVFATSGFDQPGLNIPVKQCQG